MVPPLHPDVAIVHVQRADASGNAHIWGSSCEQKEVAFAARKCDRDGGGNRPEEEIRSDPNRTLSRGYSRTRWFPCRTAPIPLNTQGYYARDNALYLQWTRSAKANPGGDPPLPGGMVYGVNAGRILGKTWRRRRMPAGGHAAVGGGGELRRLLCARTFHKRKDMEKTWTPAELMTNNASLLLRDGDVVF